MTTTYANPAAPPKPRLRGWIHAVTVPIVVIAGIALLLQANTGTELLTCAIFIATAIELFTCSAIYHLGRWQPRTHAVLRRLDHANIFCIIAGTYTPLATLLLDGTARVVLLWIVWVGAVAGLLMRVFWLGAPRWLYVPIYLGLGWVAIGFLPQMVASGGFGIVAWIIAGGVAYTLGAICYGLKRPNPSPTWFGFHEIFHSFTVVGFWCHFTAIWLTAAG